MLDKFMAMFDMVAYPKFFFEIHSLVFELLLQKIYEFIWDTSETYYIEFFS
jgi:hypothetical protein